MLHRRRKGGKEGGRERGGREGRRERGGRGVGKVGWREGLYNYRVINYSSGTNYLPWISECMAVSPLLFLSLSTAAVNMPSPLLTFGHDGSHTLSRPM